MIKGRDEEWGGVVMGRVAREMAKNNEEGRIGGKQARALCSELIGRQVYHRTAGVVVSSTCGSGVFATGGFFNTLSFFQGTRRTSVYEENGRIGSPPFHHSCPGVNNGEDHSARCLLVLMSRFVLMRCPRANRKNFTQSKYFLIVIKNSGLSFQSFIVCYS